MRLCYSILWLLDDICTLLVRLHLVPVYRAYIKQICHFPGISETQTLTHTQWIAGGNSYLLVMCLSLVIKTRVPGDRFTFP